MIKTIEQFKIENTWIYQMDHSKGLDGHSNYSGSIDKADWIVSVGRNRDSDIMQESNFDSALELLGGESKHVAIERFGHWACGWFELILVNPKSKKHVQIAYEIYKGLEDYPLVNEDDYYEREREYQSDYANGAKNNLAKALAKHFGLKHSTKLVQIAYDLNIECQNYYGNDSCIDIYEKRIPDKRDLEKLKQCLNDIEYNYKTSKVFKELTKKIA